MHRIQIYEIRDIYLLKNHGNLSEINPYGFAYTLGDFGVTMGQVLSLPMILLGVVLLCTSVLRKQKLEKNVSS